MNPQFQNTFTIHYTDESTLKYQKFSLNSFGVSAQVEGTIFQIIQENPVLFEIGDIFSPICLPLSGSVTIKQNENLIGLGSFARVYQFPLNLKGNLAFRIHEQCSGNQIKEIFFESGQVLLVQEEFDLFFVFVALDRGYPLDKYIQETDIGLQEFQSIYQQILDSILKMHSLHIAHRDIKPQNFLYINGRWVLSDFGCAMIYQKVKGKYKIAGTKQYLPKYIRNQIKNRYDCLEFEMNLLDNDIYAFLLTMLQIYKKNLSIEILQNIIETKNHHEFINDNFKNLFNIYQKSCSFIKMHILVNPNLISINSLFLQQQINNYQQPKPINYYEFEKYIKFFQLLFYHFDQQKRKRKQSKQQIMNLLKFNLGRELNEEEKLLYENFWKYVQIMFYYQSDWQNNEIFLINQNTQKWQYDAIQENYYQLFNIEMQLQACQQYQKYADNKYQIELKLFEIDRLMFMGQDQLAAIKIKFIEEQDFLDEISLLLLRCYKLIQNHTFIQKACNLIHNLILNYKHSYNLIFLQHNVGNSLQTYEGCKNQLIFFQQFQNTQFVNHHHYQFLKAALHYSSFFQIEEFPSYSIQNWIKYFQSLLDDDNHQIIKDVIEYLSNPKIKMYLWKVLLEYSKFFYNNHKYELSLHYACQSLSNIFSENFVQVIEVNIMIYYSLLRLCKYERAKELFGQLIYQIRSQQFCDYILVLLQKLTRGIQILFEHKQFNDLNIQSQLLISAFSQNSDENIQSLIFIIEWENLLAFQNLEQLQKKFSSEGIYLFKNGIIDDISTMRSIQNIKNVSKKEAQKSLSFKFFSNLSAKFLQNLIVCQDLQSLTQTETFSIMKETKMLRALKKFEHTIRNKAKLIDQRIFYQF